MITWWRKWVMVVLLTKGISEIIKVADSKPTLTATGWIYTKYGDFYVRVQTAMTNDNEYVRTITLASVEIREKYRRRGFFTAAIAAIEQHAIVKGFPVVVVAEVHNEDLAELLLRRGYLPRQFHPLSWIKTVNK